MDHFLTKKTLAVTRGHTYTYYTNPPDASSPRPKPTVLLVHGWPDDASCWSRVIRDTILPEGYGVVAPDLLGSGESSKPLDEREYDFRKIAGDVVEILEKEDVAKVVLWAHDWGAAFASRIYNYHPSRALALTLTNTNYFAPNSTPFSIDALIELTQKTHGYGICWYWHLFASDEAPQLMTDHIDTLWTILHGSGETWLETFCKENGFRDALFSDRRKSVLPYANEEMKKEWVSKVLADDGLRLKASLMWYRALANGFQDEANTEATQNLVLKVPYLLVRAEDDVCCKGEDHEMLKKAGLLGEDADTEVMGGAHWVMLSHPKEYGRKIVSWLKKKGF
ncbi:uncharacterized protein A1O9_02935 [Exophiala aquamarina CBS 119918]|uniref:AB hydrolase-1 domain-containing protein n=1 Tax=Exophiala aquamarina CBS 119918 TaxID=1182545 RepID=A0A072PMS1_9EURO|nr:uncharacterized protein A1O9_02935 [Exophiala aquamarina CBS 119918]KEF61369.1 hypothetical protein A1O9_02935 [Exophiala aquamarina CBS 119918]